MKRKDFVELKSKEIGELKKLLGEKKLELVKIYPEIAMGREKNTKKAGLLKKDIARIATLINEKEIVKKEEAKDENIQR